MTPSNTSHARTIRFIFQVNRKTFSIMQASFIINPKFLSNDRLWLGIQGARKRQSATLALEPGTGVRNPEDLGSMRGE
jgi:hypothetical protein